MTDETNTMRATSGRGPLATKGLREVHDFTRQRWGRALHSPRMHEGRIYPPLWRRLFLRERPECFSYLSAMGHSTPRPREGEELRVAMASGKVARFLVVEVRFLSDPDDMFDLKRADFVRYEEPGEL